MTHDVALARRLAAEAGGTAFLAAALAGSATMAERLASASAVAALLASAIAAGCALIALMLSFESISGGYFNPASTLRAAWTGDLKWSDAALYAAAQTLGAIVGVGTVCLLLGDPVSMPAPFELSTLRLRRIELVAAFGFVVVDACCRHTAPRSAPYAVAAYVAAAICALGTTCAANPAVAIAAAALSPPSSVAAGALLSLLMGQLGGALASTFIMSWLLARGSPDAAGSVVALHAARSDKRSSDHGVDSPRITA